MALTAFLLVRLRGLKPLAAQDVRDSESFEDSLVGWSSKGVCVDSGPGKWYFFKANLAMRQYEWSLFVLTAAAVEDVCKAASVTPFSFAATYSFRLLFGLWS